MEPGPGTLLVIVTMCRRTPNRTPHPKLRMTRQRRVILEEVRSLRSHPTAEEVYERVRTQLPRISLATIYRNLEKLSECGLLHRLELSGPRRRYDDRPGHHYHVRCLRCGGMQDVETGSLRAVESSVGRASRYKILGHRLEFVGLCPRCKRSISGGGGGGQDVARPDAQKAGSCRE